jgi:hypothetical protein
MASVCDALSHAIRCKPYIVQSNLTPREPEDTEESNVWAEFYSRYQLLALWKNSIVTLTIETVDLMLVGEGS